MLDITKNKEHIKICENFNKLICECDKCGRKKDTAKEKSVDCKC